MSIQSQSTAQDARELVWQYLSNSASGVSIFSDPPDPQELTPGDIVYNEQFIKTNGYITVAKGPYPLEEYGMNPKVVVSLEGSVSQILTLPPSWYKVDDIVSVKVLTRDWLANDQGFNLQGSTAKQNLINSVQTIINSNQQFPDTAGVWSWMHILGPGNPADKLTGGTPDMPGTQPLYVTTVRVALERFTQLV